MGSILGLERALVHKPEISLVNQSCALQSVIRPLPAQVVPCDSTQLFVNQGDQRFQSVLVSGTPPHKKFRHRFGMLLIHSQLHPKHSDVKIDERFSLVNQNAPVHAHSVEFLFFHKSPDPICLAVPAVVK